MSFQPVEWVKKHPLETAGVAVVAIGAIFLLMSISGGGGTASVPSGGGTATSALTLQQDAENAAASGQAQAQNFTLAENAQNIAGQLSLTQVQLTGAQDQIAASLQENTANNALAAYQTEVNANLQTTATAAQLSAITAQLSQQEQINQNNNATTLGLANINSNTQITQAADFTDLEKTIATTQAAVAEAQTNATVQIAGINAQVSEHASNNSLAGAGLGLIGSLIGAFL